MTSYTSQLDDITEHWTDQRVADLLALAIVEPERIPYCFLIDHNTRGPGFPASPVAYDFETKGGVGIETMDKEKAREWLAKAILLGYTAHHAGPEQRRRSGLKPRQPYGDSYSIRRARQRADWKRRPQDDTDDIPF